MMYCKLSFEHLYFGLSITTPLIAARVATFAECLRASRQLNAIYVGVLFVGILIDLPLDTWERWGVRF